MSVSLAGLRSDSPLIQFMGWDGELHYPSDDGELMSGDDTLHYEWIRLVYHSVREVFEEREDVFVAAIFSGIRSKAARTSGAPDTMVVLAGPRGRARPGCNGKKAALVPIHRGDRRPSRTRRPSSGEAGLLRSLRRPRVPLFTITPRNVFRFGPVRSRTLS